MTEERPSLRRAFVALEHRSFRLLFLSSITSGMGAQLQQIANLWQVYALTGSAVHLGLTGVVRAIPIVLFSLIGGVIADRFDRRKIIIATQMTNGLVAVLLGALSATGLIAVWHIYAAVFINATMMSASAPARRAVIANIVPRQHLMNAMALNSSLHQADRIVAPAVAGVLIATLDVAPTYAINGLAHFLTAAALGFISLGPVPERPAGSPLRNLVDGLVFVRQRHIILALLASDLIATVFGSFQVLLPIVADQFDAGPAGFGLLSSAPAVGGFVGVTAIMYLGDFRYKGRLIVGAIFAYAGFLALLALAPWFALAFVAAAGLGMTDSMQAAPRNAVIQLLCPDELRGRVSSFQQMLVSGGPAIGQGLMGAAASAVGAPAALLIGSTLCGICIVALYVGRPDLRDRDLGKVAPAALAAR